MSILIKGMKMPKDGCKDCLLVKRGNVFDICPFLKREVNGNVERGGKPYDCPLVELPDHGDLIDRDAMRKDWKFSDSCNRCERDAYRCQYYEEMSIMDVCGMLDDAPVVIPAERSKE